MLKTWLIISLSVLCLASFAAAQDILPEGNALLVEIDRKLMPENSESYKKIINIEPNGAKKEFILYVVKKGNDKMVSTFLEPKSEVGRSTLRLGDNMWLYIPNVAKPVRITSLQSVIGGVFNNSDILQIDYHAEYDVVAKEQEGEQTVLTLKAKTNAVAYDSLRMRLDAQYSLPDRIECYAASKMLIKTLYFKEIKDFGEGMIRPAVTETDSPLYKGYKSVMIFADIKPRDVDDEAFTVNNMHKIKDLRQ